MTILSWNIQGGFKDLMCREMIVEFIRDTKADIILIQEPGTLDQDNITHLRRILKMTFGEVKIIYQRFNCRYGGVLTILTNDWVNRFKKLICNSTQRNTIKDGHSYRYIPPALQKYGSRLHGGIPTNEARND
jgi:exonuclease III